MLTETNQAVMSVLMLDQKNSASIHCVDEKTGRLTTGSLELTTEARDGYRIVRLKVLGPDSGPDQPSTIIALRAGASLSDFGHAIVNASEGDRLDDTVEAWQHTKEPVSASRLRDIEEALRDPCATSRGHKRTIRVARELLDEVVRLRAALAFVTSRRRAPGEV